MTNIFKSNRGSFKSGFLTHLAATVNRLPILEMSQHFSRSPHNCVALVVYLALTLCPVHPKPALQSLCLETVLLSHHEGPPSSSILLMSWVIILL